MIPRAAALPTSTPGSFGARPWVNRYCAYIKSRDIVCVGLSRGQQPESLKAIEEPHSVTADGATAIARINPGESLDPLSLIINLNIGSVLYFAGETDAALAQIRKTQEMDPNFVETYLEFGMVYAQKGMYAEAIAELNRAAPSEIFVSRVLSLIGYNYALWGKRDEAVKRLDELKELSKRRRFPARDMAIIYTGLGEKAQAFEWLRQACEERNGLIVYLKFDPLFKSLRTDPRFADMLQCIGLPP
jgi:tetratricopeptide (TPR) repeat protein